MKQGRRGRKGGNNGVDENGGEGGAVGDLDESGPGVFLRPLTCPHHTHCPPSFPDHPRLFHSSSALFLSFSSFLVLPFVSCFHFLHL